MENPDLVESTEAGGPGARYLGGVIQSLQAASPSPHRVFSLERELVATLAPRSISLLQPHADYHRAAEVEIGRRFADLVVSGFEEELDKKSVQAFVRCPVHDLAILALLLERPLTSTTVARRLNCSPAWADARLASLCRRRLAHVSPTGAYGPTGWRDHLPTTVVAIEAKLVDWSEAVRQAAYYSSFADFAWVALPSERVPYTAVGGCREAGVGLVVVSPEGLVERRVDPRRSRASARNRRLMALQILRDVAMRGHDDPTLRPAP